MQPDRLFSSERESVRELGKGQDMAARAGKGEEVEVRSWKAKLGAEYADVVDKARNMAESRQVEVYKADTGLGRGILRSGFRFRRREDIGHASDGPR